MRLINSSTERRRRCAAIISGRVLDEGAGIAEVVDILARGALAGFAAARDGVGPRGVEADRMALANLGEIGADVIEIDGFGAPPSRRPADRRTPR